MGNQDYSVFRSLINSFRAFTPALSQSMRDLSQLGDFSDWFNRISTARNALRSFSTLKQTKSLKISEHLTTPLALLSFTSGLTA